MAWTIGILFSMYSAMFEAADIAMGCGIQREDRMKAGPKKDEDPDDPNSGAVV